MLQLGGSLINKDVLSLRSGSKIAQVISPIINPNNLKIEGFYCQDRLHKHLLVLLTQDIRENGPHGFIVNDHDALSEPNELVRLQEVIKLEFELLQKPVVTAGKSKLGKVNDYAVDSESLIVQKIYVGQSLMKSFSGGQLSIDRNQIVEITNRKIVVQDPLQGDKQAVGATATA